MKNIYKLKQTTGIIIHLNKNFPIEEIYDPYYFYLDKPYEEIGIYMQEHCSDESKKNMQLFVFLFKHLNGEYEKISHQ